MSFSTRRDGCELFDFRHLTASAFLFHHAIALSGCNLVVVFPTGVAAAVVARTDVQLGVWSSVTADRDPCRLRSCLSPLSPMA
ncbi:hypothetical protein L6452_27872 [Arctium lappa]|uniref:Uncharacterized protein n=1 Tax=Arctium lappa TaxID=4217 RepID=A0ACB8ZXW5_ARCLA|nr:hypothetical protein L6452_27872 [Arctium lappa]